MSEPKVVVFLLAEENAAWEVEITKHLVPLVRDGSIVIVPLDEVMLGIDALIILISPDLIKNSDTLAMIDAGVVLGVSKLFFPIRVREVEVPQSLKSFQVFPRIGRSSLEDTSNSNKEIASFVGFLRESIKELGNG